MTKIIVMGQEYTNVIAISNKDGSLSPVKRREVKIVEFAESANPNVLIMLNTDGSEMFRYSRKELEENNWVELSSFKR